jgi:hypothetical protein
MQISFPADSLANQFNWLHHPLITEPGNGL